MKKITCKICLASSKQKEVNAYEAVPGLAIHKGGFDSWYVTHVSSGLSVTPSELVLGSRKEAVRWAKCLAEVLDFTSSTDLIEKSMTMDTVPSIIKLFRSGHCPESLTECSRAVLRTRK